MRFADAIRVDANGTDQSSAFRATARTAEATSIYGVAPPQGTLSLTNVASTLAGATPTAANNGTARLADIDVITGNTFTVQLNTTPVTLPAPAGEVNPVRDVHADGDTAMIRIDGGLNVNGVAGIDHVTPGSVVYGFEELHDDAHARLHLERQRPMLARARGRTRKRSMRRSSPRDGTT